MIDDVTGAEVVEPEDVLINNVPVQPTIHDKEEPAQEPIMIVDDKGHIRHDDIAADVEPMQEPIVIDDEVGDDGDAAQPGI